MIVAALDAAPHRSVARAQLISVVRAAIVGTTASGKSSVALAAAAAVRGLELVSVDAMQVYCGMDIGTAKPSAAEQAAVRHHLIDLVTHTDSFTLADYQVAMGAAVTDVADRSRRVIAVGGTGLYLRSVVDGLDLPGQWPELRDQLEATPDVARLFARLSALDPVAAGRMEPTNRRRIIRALEVCLGSGQPFSSFGPGLELYPAEGVTQLGLRWPRERLVDRIGERVRAMVDRGLVDARHALGYREFGDYLDGRGSLDDAIEATTLHTRQFAVRQERWFRRDPRIRWIDVEHDPVEECLPTLMRLIDP
jgi:tRNA dimethylallyltransferase